MSMPTIQPKFLSTQPESKLIDQVMTNLGYRLLGYRYGSYERTGEFATEQEFLTPYANCGATFIFTKEDAIAMEHDGKRLFGTNLIARALSDNPELNTHWKFFYFHKGNRRSTDPGHGLIVLDQYDAVIYVRDPDQSPKINLRPKVSQEITQSDDLRASA